MSPSVCKKVFEQLQLHKRVRERRSEALYREPMCASGKYVRPMFCFNVIEGDPLVT